MEIIPDIKKAERQGYYFAEYSRAFIVTNEDLRTTMKYMPENCNMALTVAASGDHPLFCSLYGAKHVDTFDISYNAKCIMDIKTAAIGELKLSEYLKLLENLHATHDVATVPNMDKISKKLPAIEYNYMCEMAPRRLFNFIGIYDKHDPVLPNGKEYKQLQKSKQSHYDFYWTNISDLGNCLTQKYDFMHLSNIFDYIYDWDFQGPILENLLKHVNIGGRVVIQHLRWDPWDDKYLAKVVFRGDSWIKNHCRFIQGQNEVSIFERVR